MSNYEGRWSIARLTLITTFGLGRLRPAPGTWGSLPPLAIPATFVLLGINPAGSVGASLLYNGLLILILIAFSLACLCHGDEAEAFFLRKDPSEVVADETAAQCIPLLFLPAQAFMTLQVAIFTIVFAFVAFRVLDIVKPWPAFRMQRLPGGAGILVDDLFAGVYAALILQILTRTML